MSTNPGPSSSKRADHDQEGTANGKWFRVPANLTSDNQPWAPDDTEDPVVKHYETFPTRRNLDWRNEKQQALNEGCQLQAAYAHTRGEAAVTLCHPCTEEKGPWDTCIAREHLGFAKWTSTDRACTNCFFDGRETECNHASAPAPADELTTLPKRRTRNFIAPQSQSQIHLQAELEKPNPILPIKKKQLAPRRYASPGNDPYPQGPTNPRSKSRFRRRPGPVASRATTLSTVDENQGDGEQHTPTMGTSGQTAAEDEETTDLEALLPASAYEDLPRLKRTRSDLVRVGLALQRRITQLEINKEQRGKQKKGWSPWKPWLEG
ncbi:hypothetical protein BDW74DRAFT_180084 [Aspergillus multicolor]|uniref:DUF3716 domain-containing protein n=1 Tax=Aspergillus multicolor TaxID=41759 RepID=UPI003CCE4596